MRHFRIINVFFVALLFFTVAAIADFDYLKRDDIWLQFPKEYIFAHCFHEELSAYFCRGFLAIVVTLCAQFAVEYTVTREETFLLIRDSRQGYFIYRVKVQFIVIVIIVMTHLIIGICRLTPTFGFDYMVNKGVLKYFIFTALLNTLYMMKHGFIYMMLRDLINKKLSAIIAAQILSLTEFGLSAIVFRNMWVPYEDLSIGYYIFLPGNDNIIYMIALLRQTALMILFGALGLIVFEKRDVLSNV